MRKLCGIILIIFLNGCVLHASGGSGSSFDGLSNRYGGDAQVFADRTAQELGRRYTPAQNSLALQKAPGIFGDSLEQALRSRGFAVVPPHASGVAVSYTIDILEIDGVPTKGYVQVTLADGRVFTFSRELENGPPLPTNAPVAMDENTPLPVPVQEVELPVAQAPAVKPAQPVVTAPPAQASVPAAPQSPDIARPPHTVRASATATHIAKRNKVSVTDFCRWNEVSPSQTLPTGYRVHLQQPAHTPAPVVIPVAQSVPIPPQQNFVPLVSPSVASATSPVAAPVPHSPPLPQPVATVSQEMLPSPSQDAKQHDAKEETPTASLPTSAPAWLITPGNLQAQISAWAAQANYQLIWKTQNDFEMETHARFQGDFLDAIRQLFMGLQRSGHALRVTLYQGNNVLEVSEE